MVVVVAVVVVLVPVGVVVSGGWCEAVVVAVRVYACARACERIRVCAYAYVRACVRVCDSADERATRRGALLPQCSTVGLRGSPGLAFGSMQGMDLVFGGQAGRGCEGGGRTFCVSQDRTHPSSCQACPTPY